MANFFGRGGNWQIEEVHLLDCCKSINLVWVLSRICARIIPSFTPRTALIEKHIKVNAFPRQGKNPFSNLLLQYPKMSIKLFLLLLAIVQMNASTQVTNNDAFQMWHTSTVRHSKANRDQIHPAIRINKMSKQHPRIKRLTFFPKVDIETGKEKPVVESQIEEKQLTTSRKSWQKQRRSMLAFLHKNHGTKSGSKHHGKTKSHKRREACLFLRSGCENIHRSNGNDANRLSNFARIG